MLIFHKEKLVILATPKTGSTSLERALLSRADISITNPPGHKHMRAERVRATVLPVFFKKEAHEVKLVAVMREPIDWLGSWYRYRTRPEISGNPNSTANYSFDEFIEHHLQNTPPAFAKVGSQYNFMHGGDGTCLVDHIFDYAQINVFYSFLRERLSYPIAPDYLNRSPDIELLLSEKTKARLMNFRRQDFDLYSKVSSSCARTSSVN